MLLMAEVEWWQRVKARIERLGLTPYAVAKATGLSRPAIVNIMAGDTKYPRRETIQAIAKALDVSEEWILEGDVPSRGVVETRTLYQTEEELFRALTRQYGRPGDDWRELAAFFEVYRQLPPEQRDGWLTVLRFNANVARGEGESSEAQQG